MDIKQSEVQKAVELLRQGEVVGLPTETVYGLAGDAFNKEAIEKIFKTKERPFFDPLIVHISNLNQLSDVVSRLDKLPEYLAQKFWPGPLTMVLPKKESIDPMITSGLDTVGVRFPRHPLAQEIISQLGHPVAAPSANKFKKTSPTSADHVRGEFEDSVFVVDGGPCDVGLESTVIGFSFDFKVLKIYRPGAITKSHLEEALVEFDKSISVVFEKSQVAPGHLEYHYMPKIPLVILESTDMNLERICEKLHLSQAQGVELKLSADASLTARQLYQNLRLCAETSGAGFIYVYKTSLHKDDLWTAIWDRLNKAASLKI